jgi:hypothetical protein
MLLDGADAVLFHRLRQIGAGDCFFAYRTLLVQAKRALPLEQARTLSPPRPSLAQARTWPAKIWLAILGCQPTRGMSTQAAWA